ncbi:hypothetical protein [Polyangium aurulentum]|uniref:hypothetical protein n=1 Tax=Polyangium aurulentum TaxID=2567896 RepID=UPI0010AEA772|nr:hypothetical protein [Polyangium aurulentum]UQA58591.1 hypothetical protein E8A73_046375 [Polyangium aurulentum]
MPMYFFPSWWWKWWQQGQQSEPAPSPPGGTAPAPAFFRWFHREGDFATVAAAALETAKREAWSVLDEKTRRRQLRAFVMLSLQIAPLSANPGPLGALGAHLYSTQDRNAAGSAIARTFVLLAPAGLRPTRDVITEEDQQSTYAMETGLPAFIVVVLATLGALAAAYIASVGAEAAHAINFDEEITKRMLSAHARALEVMSMHVERERIAGRELPFDEVERSLLLGLEDVQRQLATMQRKPLPSPFQGATEFVRTATGSFLPIAALALLVLFILNQPQRRT